MCSFVIVDLLNLTKKYALNAVCMCERDCSRLMTEWAYAARPVVNATDSHVDGVPRLLETGIGSEIFLNFGVLIDLVLLRIQQFSKTSGTLAVDSVLVFTLKFLR